MEELTHAIDSAFVVGSRYVKTATLWLLDEVCFTVSS